MGIDLSSVWGEAKDAASQGMSDLLKQGGNAGLGYLEQQAIQVIQADQKTHVEAYQAATANQLAKPSSPNSFSAYLSNITQSPVLKQYGPYMVAAAALVAIAIFWGRK